MLDAVQARACGKHPAGKNPLHLALQGDFVDLDKGIGVGGLGGGTGVAGVGLHAQRAELNGLADVFIEIDDAAGNLVQSRKARLLVDDLLRRRLGHHFVTGLQCRGHRRHRALLLRTLPRWNVDAGRRDRDTLIGLTGLRRRHGDAGLRILRNDRGAGRRRERLRRHASRRRHALTRRRPVGRRQQAPARQFGDFFFVVGNSLRLLATTGNAARRPWLIGKDIADLRVRRRRKRDRRNGNQGRKTGQQKGFDHLADITSESGVRH